MSPITEGLLTATSNYHLDGEDICLRARRELIELRASHARLLAALKTIAYEPIGPADASCIEVLDGVTQIARAAITAAEELEK